MAHTPGPWDTFEHQEVQWIRALSDGTLIGTVYKAEDGPIVAAAPDLLDSLAALAALDRTPDRHASPELRAARAAIAKAEAA